MLEEALSDIKMTLENDGFEFSCEQKQEGNIDVYIIAGPNACKDCLMSESILEMIIKDSLSGHGIFYTNLTMHMPFSK